MADTAIYPVTVAESDQTYYINMQLDESIDIAMAESIQIINSQTYQGDYTVIPKAREEVILPTKDLVMTDDVTVNKVPYFETSNLTGKTIYIASEV